MTVKRVVVLAVFAVLGGSPVARAQSPYIGASFFGDIVRTSHTESIGFDENPGSGEAVGFALRVGAPLDSTWGVELEYARPATIRSDAQLVYPLSPLLEIPPPAVQEVLAGLPTIYPPIYPIPLALESRDRHTTLSAVLWTMHMVSQRFALIYLGGVAFNRFEREYQYGFGDVAISSGPGIVQLPSITSRTIAYSARPVVGLESWIGLTERVTLTPSIRLQTVQDGWSVRPGIGIAWSL